MPTKKTFKCKSAGLSAGKNNVKMSFSIDLSAAFDANAAHELFVGAQLDVTVRDQNDVPGQIPMKGAKTEEQFIGSVQKIGLGADSFSVSLAIHKDSVKLDDLARFTFRTVKATFERTGDAAPADGADEDGNKGDVPE